MTKEVEPSVKDEQRILLDFIAEPVGWSNGNTSEQQDAAFAALRRLRHQLQEAEERAKKTWWNKREHELEDEIAALEEAAATTLSLAESERDAAIERAEKAEAQAAEWGESLARWGVISTALFRACGLRGGSMDDVEHFIRQARSTITQKDEQIEDVIAALARWVDNDPSVSPGENIRMLQDALASQLHQKDEALERVAEMQPKTLAMLQREGFKFETPLHLSDGWEKLAFTLYSTICEVDSIARNALSTPETGETDG